MVIMTKMKRCSVADAKAHLPELIRDAERDGKETILERRGRPVARIAPLLVAEPSFDALAAFDRASIALKKTKWRGGTLHSALSEGRGRLD